MLAIGFVAALVTLAAVILYVGDVVSGRRSRDKFSARHQAEQRAQYERRLVHPDWTFYEQHLGRPVPAVLRELFAKAELLTRSAPIDLGALVVTSFEPLDSQGLADTRPWAREDAIAFARRDGDPIFLRAGAGQADEVYVTHHDGGETENLGAIEEFIGSIFRRVEA